MLLFNDLKGKFRRILLFVHCLVVVAKGCPLFTCILHSSSEHEESNADPLHQELFPRRLRDEEGNRKDRSGSTNIRPTTDPTNGRHGKKKRHDQIGKEKNPCRKIRAIGEKKRISATVGRPFECLQGYTTFPGPHERAGLHRSIANHKRNSCKRTEVRRHPSWSRQELQHTVQVEIAALAYSLRWQAAMEAQPGLNIVASGTNTNNTTLSKTCPFATGRKEPPRKNYATEKAIQELQMDVQNLVDKCKLSFTPNITIRERKAIADLRTKDDAIITRSDKGGELVVKKESRLKELCLAHLSDKMTCKRLKKDPTNDI